MVTGWETWLEHHLLCCGKCNRSVKQARVLFPVHQLQCRFIILWNIWWPLPVKNKTWSKICSDKLLNFKPHYLHFTDREMDVQKWFAQVITINGRKRSKTENPHLLLSSEEWLHVVCENYIWGLRSNKQTNKQSLVDFALNFLDRMSFLPARDGLVWRWEFSSSGEWRFCWRNNSRLIVAQYGPSLVCIQPSRSARIAVFTHL